ncbi:hypothetical protein ACROYT_G001097 [Oculina patagonica]
MAFKYIFALVILAFVVDAMKWRNCDQQSSMRINQVSMSPQSSRMGGGRKVTLGGKFSVAGATGTHYKLHLTLKRRSEETGRWVRVPCFGMCDHEVKCDDLAKTLEGAQCPLKPGTYMGTQTFDLPYFLKSSQGQYQVTGELRDKRDNKRIACLQMMNGAKKAVGQFFGFLVVCLIGLQSIL